METEPPPTVDVCPADTSEGAAFSAALGTTWTYDLTTYRKPRSSLATRSTGRVEVEVVEVEPCSAHTQRLRVRERRAELVEHERPRDGSYSDLEWVADEDSTGAERFYTWTVRDSIITTDAPDIQGRGTFGPPPFGREAPRVWDGETLNTGIYSAFGPFVTLTRDVGPTRYYVVPLYGTPGQAYEKWKYVGE
ncbi:hypothetical protein [Rubrivirga marina]|uniref:hypothetical protein n=1 Tax=Rubrivirga marina TaxID=1196024 RepID=UPI00117B4F94|nr:hypothetical protein [Rubrivirga marina]